MPMCFCFKLLLNRGSGKTSGFRLHPLFILFQKNQIISHDVGYVEVNDPVHQVEADEAHGEHDARVLVNVRRSHAQQFAYIL